MIVCAGDIEQFSFATSIGIGIVSSAINLTKICLEHKPDEILFVGTAGSYGNVKLMSIVESTSATNIEQSFLRGDAYTPLDSLISSKSNVSHETIVNSSNYICTNNRMAMRYMEKGIDIENMEFYAILKVAEEFGIPASGIFGITNYCDENAHEEFLENHYEVMLNLSAYVQEKKNMRLNDAIVSPIIKIKQ